MSILSYLVIADRSDADEVWDKFLSKKFSWHDMPGLDPNDLIELHSILAGRRVSKSLKKEHALLVPEDPDDAENWVFAVPEELVKLVAGPKNSSVHETAELWLERPGWMSCLDHWTLEDTENRVEEIRTIAKQVIKKKKSMLFWLSL